MILFDKVQVPHYNYVGDSILGYRAHIGSRFHHLKTKSDKLLVKVHAEDGDIETGIKKFGAMLGDCVEIGCSSVPESRNCYWKELQYLPVIQRSRVRGWEFHL